jgi:hypothetical protein
MYFFFFFAEPLYFKPQKRGTLLCYVETLGAETVATATPHAPKQHAEQRIKLCIQQRLNCCVLSRGRQSVNFKWIEEGGRSQFVM